MASMALGSVERVFKAGLAIKKAVKTVKQNKKECRDIENSVARVGALLSLLNETTEIFNHPAMRGPLDDLAESLEEALQLIKDCEGRHPVFRLFGAGGMARELGRVHDDILRKLMLGNFATTVHITITLTRTVQYGVAHGPHLQIQDAGNTYTDHLTTDDARSGINSETTMVTSASEVPCDPSSRSTEFNLSGLEATMHHISEENTSRGGGHLVLKQKIVIKIDMPSHKSQCKAISLSARMDGAISMAITGDDRNKLEVVGVGMDAVCLLRLLRKRLGHAEILQVEEVKDKKPQPVEVDDDTKEAPPAPVEVDDTEEAPPAVANGRRRSTRSGIRGVLTKLSKFMWPHARRRRSMSREQTDRPDVSPPTADISAATPPPASSSAWLLPLRQPAVHTAPASPPGRDLTTMAADPLLPPTSVQAPARRRRRRTFDMSRVRRSARLPTRAQGNSASRNAGATHEELGTLEPVGCVLEDCVALFDGPLPPAVIAAVTGALFHVDGEGSTTIHTGDALSGNGTVEM